jgi:hypothetical protein
MSQPLTEAEIVVLLEGDISDVEDADLQDDVEEEIESSCSRQSFG